MANNNFLTSPFDSVAVDQQFSDTPTVKAETPKPQPKQEAAPSFKPRVAGPSKDDLIARATELGVDPNLALSFFSQESSGNWNSKDSPKGARGGMQVMPGTYKMMMGTTAGQDDPWNNMEAGLRYIRYGQKKLKTTDPELLAAGYHAGYDNPALARGQIPNTNDGMISTRDYAKSVAKRAGKTSSIDDQFSDKPPALTDADFSDTPIVPGIASAKDGEDWDKEAAEQQKKIDAAPYWDRLTSETKAGFGDMVRSIDTARWALGAGDDADIAKQISDSIIAQSKAQKTTGQKQIDAAYQNVTDAKGVIDTTVAGAKALWASATHPKDTFIEVARNAANSLPTLGAGAAGAGAGAAAGSVIPGAGTALGAVIGGRAGMVAGTTATELGAEIQDMVGKRLQEAQQPPTAQNVLAILSDQKFKEDARKQGLAKGLTVAAVDQVFLGIGGKVATAPARKIATRDLASQGVDVGTRAARKEALASAAGQTALQAAKPSIASRAGAGAAALGVDAAGESLGEGLSQQVARGNVDYGDALREGVTSLGQSAVEVGIGVAEQGYKAGRQAAASIVQPTKSEATGPLARAAENAATESERVTITAPNGEQVTGDITGKAEDGTTQVTTDDGQQVTFKVGENGITMEPEAPNTPLSNAVEAAAIEQPEAKPAEQPAAQPAPAAAEAPAIEEEPKQTAPVETIERPAAPAKVDYSTMTEPELTQRLDYLKSQAKTNGGWNRMLIDQRRAVENAISKLPKQTEQMQQFGPETGTLGVPRAEMPQVKSEHHGALVNHLNAQGIAHETTTVDAATLKPTQAEYSPAKVELAKEEGNGERSIIVSSDNHIIDGHHQAIAAAEKGEQVKAIVLDAPAEKALEAVKQFPSATTEGKPQKLSKADEEHLFGIPAKREKALERIAAGRAWFNDGVKAKDFITKNGLKDTHEAKKGKGGRWDIVAKPTTEESSAVQQEQTNVNDERTQQQPDGGQEGQRTEAAAQAAVQSDAAPEVRTATAEEAAIAKDAPHALDLRKNQTGWKAVPIENGNGTVLVSADGKKAITFASSNVKSGTEGVRARAKAAAYAIDNPYTQDAPTADEVKSEQDNGRRYHVVSINEKTGAKTQMTASPVTHKEAVTIKSKNTEREGRRLALEEVQAEQAVTDPAKAKEGDIIETGGVKFRKTATGFERVAYEAAAGKVETAAPEKKKQEAMPRQDFDTKSGVGKISAVKERYSEKFGVSWSSTSIIGADTMEQAAAIAKAVAESGADNISDMRMVAHAAADGALRNTAEHKAETKRRIQPGEDGYTLAMANEDLNALYDQKRKNGMIEDARLNDRIDMMNKLVDEMERGESAPKPLANATAPEHVSNGEETGVTVDELRQIAKAFRDEIDAGRDAEVTHIFDAPQKSDIVRLNDKVKVYTEKNGWMTPAEAKEQIAKWKEHAQAQYDNDDIRSANSQKVVLSFFDLSGEWSKPWEEAGYQVYRFDIQDDPTMGDVNNFSTEFFNDWFGDFEGQDIHAILAACPCTDFASSGARHFAAKDADGRTVSSVRLVKKTLAAIEYFKPAVWALENPVGRIEDLTGLPPWRLSFDPNHLGDPYTKKTLIWGRFNADLPVAPVEATEGSKMHRLYGGKSQATKNARSVTPEGFSYGFFMANNAHDNMAMTIAAKYDRLDADLIKRAIDSGVTEDEINNAVEDFYYMDMDDEAANNAVRALIKDNAPTEPTTKAKADPFAGNKLFTADKVAAARARMKEKLSGAQLNSGIDPELLMDGMVIAGAYIESGVRNFADYAGRMVDDLGDGVKPYLLSFWEAARNYPGIDNKDMTSVRESARAHAAMMAANETKEGDNGNANTAPSAGSAGDRALEGVPAEDVRQPEASGNAEPSGNGRGAEDAGRAGIANKRRNPARSGVGNGEGAVPVPAGRGRSQRGSAGQSGLFDEPAAEQASQRNIEVTKARESKPAAANYKITDLTKLGEGGQKTKYRNNVAAIKLLNELQQTGRQATAEEQDVLARYVGWGGIAQAFDQSNNDWSNEYAELKALLSPEEWESAKESTQYAHYTSQEIIGSIYDAVKRFGFGGGTVLEPGSGVGNFMGMLPDALRGNTRFTAVERERIAGGIAKLLYPNHNVQQDDFRKFNAQDGYFDIAIGNPPFASTTLTDMTGRKHLSGLSVHNYFFAKSVDMLREGGVLAMVVSNSFMDAKNDRARKYIGERAELLGAIRLPNNAFAKNANTEVTTDIIFLKKRPENEWGSKAAKEDMRRWVDTGSISDPRGGESIPVNRYFIDNPSMMLGSMERAGSMYGPGQPALIARNGQDTASLLKQAVQNLPEGVYQSAAVANTAAMEDAAVEKLSDKANVDVGGHYVDGDKLYVRMPDVAGEGRAMQLTATTKISEKKELGKNGMDRLKSLASMRVTLRGLLAAELRDDSNIDSLRKQLNTEYDAYVKQFGYINQRGTVQLFGDDPDFPLLASLELSYDPGISKAAAEKQGVKPQEPSAKKAAIFKQRVIPKYEEITSADTPEDALFVSIAERGQIDAAYIGKLLGKDGESVLKELASQKNPAVFIDPANGGYVLKDAYLSGNVRKKMEQAKAAGMFQNVAALEAVIPEDIPAHEISGKIGAPWVPVETYEEFAKMIMGDGTAAKITYVPALSSYITQFNPGSDVANKNTYGTSRMGADEILSALLNSKEIKVGHYEEDANGSRRFVLEKDQTDEANDKAREIKDKFADWLFADAERSEKLQRAYNDAVNNYVTREFDGSMLKFPGKVPDAIIKLRRHQRNAVARIIQDGRALLDHVVGAGKTFTVIAAAMELKRTGLAKKPMIAVPNHLVKQWAADFYRLYPGANILTATKKDFQRENRRKFLAKIATGNWDAVIIAHSSFGFIKPDPDFEIRFNAERVDEIIAAMQALKDEKDQNSKRTVKQLAKMKESLENKLASLRDRPMDDLLDFGQIGIDQLFVDEAHLFKNLMYVTKMQNVRGLGEAKGSQRAYDMFIKTHQLYESSENGRGVVFATGTPVSNSLAEMYHMLRYLAPETLKDSGQFTFDAWAKTFADVEQVWMQSLSGDGYKASNRMSVFANTPELLKVFDQVADTVTIEDIKKAYSEENGGKEFPIPPLKGGRRTPVSIPKSAAQNDYMQEIGERAKKLEQRKGKPQKGDDNMLSIMGDARKAAMDIRMVRPEITQRDPEGRIAVAARNVYDRYVKYDSVRGTQLIFSDMGTPKKSAEKELKEYNELMAQTEPLRDERIQAMADLGDESALDQIEKAEDAQRQLDAKGQDWADAIKMAMRGFSIYDDMKDALVELGIPENEIAFIHDYNTDDQKAALFRAVNDGKIRVLLGSTEKMGAGTNVQERAVALHHLDVPWKPSDIEQREGRVIRQGNSLINPDSPNFTPGFEVEVMAYATQDTLDLFMWQTQEKKLSMIGQLRTGNVGREVDNAFEEMQMSAGEMQAAATSNPYLLEEIQLKDRIKKLERQKRSFDGQKNDLVNRLAKAKRDIDQLPASIKRAEGIEAKAIKATEDMRAEFANMTATVNGQTVTGAMNIRAAVREAVYASPEIDKDGKKVRDIKVDFNGKEYKSESGLSEATIKALGDAVEASFTLPDGTQSYRGSETAAALFEKVSSMQDGETKKLGSIGAFDVVAYQDQGSREANLELDGEVIASEVLPKDIDFLMGRLRSMPAKFRDALNNQRGLPDYLRSKLENAKRARSEIEAMPAAGEWDGEKDLKDARDKYRDVLRKLAERESNTGGAPAMSRSKSSLEDIFAGLASDGDARTRAEQALDNLPDADKIRYIESNFYNILGELEDSGLVDIKC